MIENISGLETNAQKVETELRARQDAYFRFILWATFGLSAVRFLGVRPCVIILQRRRIQCSHGYRVVLVVFLQAQPLQVMPQEVKDRALCASQCWGAFMSSRRFQEYSGDIQSSSSNRTLILLTRHPATKNTQPNLTFSCDGLSAFCLKMPPTIPTFYCRRRPFTDSSCTYAMDILPRYECHISFPSPCSLLFGLWSDTRVYKENEGDWFGYSQAIWSAQSGKPRGPQPVLKRSGAERLEYGARKVASGLTILAYMCDTAVRVCRRGFPAA
jgi:hypothetical protein